MKLGLQKGALLQQGVFDIDDVTYLRAQDFWPATKGIYALGDNLSGALNGKANQQDMPRRAVLVLPRRAISLAASRSNSSYLYAGGMAVLDDGTLYYWGATYGGQSGNGSNTAFVIQPVQIGTASDWAKVYATGQNGFLAIKQDGSLWGTGSRSNGRLLDGTTSGSYLAFTRIGSASWSHISVAGGAAATSNHTMAIRTDGTLWTVGSNVQGKTGLGLTSGSTTTLTQVGSAAWRDVATLANNTIAIRSDGTLWSAGGFNFGLNGTSAVTSSLVQIGTDSDWSRCFGWLNTAHLIKTNGKAFAMGDTDNRRAPNPTGTPASPVRSFDDGLYSDWLWFENHSAGVYGLRADGSLLYSGLSTEAPSFINFTAQSNVALLPVRQVPTNAVASGGDAMILLSF